MKITGYNIKKEYPFVVIDNWYSKKEEECIMKELRYLFADLDIMIRAENDMSTAKNNTGITKAKSYRCYISAQSNQSFINRYTSKFLDEELQKKISEIIPHARAFPETNYNSQFVSYYENGDYYKEHIDKATFSVLIYMYEEPKNFIGGSITIENTKIECIKNRMIFFPSYYRHSVEEIKMDKIKTGYGRYTITSFYYINSNR